MTGETRAPRTRLAARALHILVLWTLLAAPLGSGVTASEAACPEGGDADACHADDVCPGNVTADARRDGIHLAWSPVDEAEGYAIHRARDGGDPVETDAVDANTTTYRDAPVRPGVTYTYKVTPELEQGHFTDCPTVETTSIPFFQDTLPLALATAATLGALVILRRR